MNADIRELTMTELDRVAGGPGSDAWGGISGGLGLIAIGLGMELGSAGLATPVAIGVVAAGVALIHVSVAQLALE